MEGKNDIVIAVSQRGRLIDANKRKTIIELKPMKKYVIKKHFNSIAIKLPDDKKFYTTKTNNLIFTTDKNAGLQTPGYHQQRRRCRCQPCRIRLYAPQCRTGRNMYPPQDSGREYVLCQPELR